MSRENYCVHVFCTYVHTYIYPHMQMYVHYCAHVKIYVPYSRIFSWDKIFAVAPKMKIPG